MVEELTRFNFITPVIIARHGLSSPSSPGGMDLDDEILARGPPSTIGACGDVSLVAEFSLTHSPIPLCHSTPIDSSNSGLEIVIHNGNNAVTDTPSPDRGNNSPKDQEKSESHMMEEVRGLDELTSVTVPPDPEVGMSGNAQAGLESSTDAALATNEFTVSGQRYWFRERKPKVDEFGDNGKKVTRVRKAKTHRKKKKRDGNPIKTRPMKRVARPPPEEPETNTTNPVNDQEEDENDENIIHIYI
ncbi:hypothetical protein LOAG_14934 [Loa loa]|uniref:Homeobox domain-containing protein n=1 Tax=Loa loa TaxID=7209 RepID=A0A1I7VIQ4_LOALO|nr:hypothetical protein LOAG_14934 [Loa loa]EFO13594.1 hypothetical protein LOAG_14934 [Loa loa]